MALSDPITLPSGLVLPNRLGKAAMAENLEKKHNPGQQHKTVYNEWSDGGWGMILTGNVMVSSSFLGSPEDLEIPSKEKRDKVESGWKAYAEASQAHGTPTFVQLNHPGRQSPAGAGTAGFREKRVSSSAVKLDLGRSLIARAATSLIFGTPRPLTIEEIRGENGIVAQFVAGAVEMQRAGFKGVQLHGAHGYLLAQFMSPRTNLRTDDYGGSAVNRVRIVVEIVRGIREATTGKGDNFSVGIKLNSVDASEATSMDDIIEQVRAIVDAGIDFIEVSGGTYERPEMMGVYHSPDDEKAGAPLTTADGKPVKASTAKREAYFLDFTRTLRQHFPKTVLMLTGGFRSRRGMQEAIDADACTLVGIGRPATVFPHGAKDLLLNSEVEDDKATMELDTLKPPFWLKWVPITPIASGYGTIYYQWKIVEMAKGTHVAGRQ